jgi:integrase
MTSEISKDELIKLYENLSNTNDDSRKLKQNTINAYVTTIMKIAKDMNKPLSVEAFKDYNTVKKFIESNNKVLTTIKNKVNAVVIFLKASGDVQLSKQYGEWVFKLRDKIDDQLGQNEKSEKEEINWMSKEDLEKVLKSLEDNLNVVNKKPTYEQLLSYQEYFILAFHIQYPLRNNLASCLIGTDPYKVIVQNYIRVRPYLKTAKMFLVDYKTSSTYGKIEFEIEGKALEVLLLYYSVLKKFISKNGKIPLIPDKDGVSLTANNYTKHFQAIFKDTGKSVSTTLIRKAIVSSMYDAKKIKELARIMGHSIDQQVNIYAKNSD